MSKKAKVAKPKFKVGVKTNYGKVIKVEARTTFRYLIEGNNGTRTWCEAHYLKASRSKK